MTQWYYSRAGQQFGPVPPDELRRLARSGQFGPTDFVWNESLSNWLPAQNVANLFDGEGELYTPAAPQPGAYPPPSQALPVQYYAGGYGAPGQYTGPRPPTYLVQSILTLIFCFWPFSIPAIVYAAQVDGKYARGDYEGAVNASKKAKLWSSLSCGIVVAFLVIYLIAVLVFGVR
jgi:hypothetical protein